MDLVQAIVAAGSLLGAGGLAILLRPWAPVVQDWLRYRYYERVEKRAVKRGQNPSALKLIQAAREGPLPRTEEPLRSLPSKPDEKRAA